MSATAQFYAMTDNKKLLWTLIVLLDILMFRHVSGEICCVPDQFEASLYYDDGNVFIDEKRVGTSYGYINASIRISYDYSNLRVFMNVSAVQVSPLVPVPEKEQYGYIMDFRKKISYQFTQMGCQASSIDPMIRQCIPDNAMQMSTGFVGSNGSKVVTYIFQRESNPLIYTATVQPNTCLPFHVVYTTGSSVPDSGTLNMYQVGDISPGIKDPSVFTPPSSCNVTIVPDFGTQKNSLQRKLNRFVVSFPYFSK